ncbi:hypothetical protein ATANTOWER_026478 [Ataeniobius toweri]|uniref:Lipoprotein n=1 Tax=Ataeniobius toweri TaxID=208326 RepID=A0ABU7BNV7_9TELE|nr:hypothetical protein [Ataeniobius toweri]
MLRWLMPFPILLSTLQSGCLEEVDLTHSSSHTSCQVKLWKDPDARQGEIVSMESKENAEIRLNRSNFEITPDLCESYGR